MTVPHPSTNASPSSTSALPALRICLVAGELLGAHKNGGIGTATTHLALWLAGQGHAVRLLYTGRGTIEPHNPWIRRCVAAGIDLVPLDGQKPEIYPVWLRETSAIFDYLRPLDHDLILFQDWQGGGFASVIARRAGLAFPRTKIAVLAHGATDWLLAANRTLARHPQTLGQLHMEAQVFALADAVVCPSRHMLDWLKTRIEVLSPETRAIPLYLWSDPEGDAMHRAPAGLDRVHTIAYFGRLETRKGVDLFVEAILSERLAFADWSIVFVGKPASRQPEEIMRLVEERCPWLVPKISFQTDLDTDAAQRFLVDNRCLAVIPSLIDNAPCVISECLRRAIPFVSTTSGGIAELIAPEDRARVLVEPKARDVALRIESLLGRPFAAARPAYGQAEVAAQWTAWLEQLAPREADQASSGPGSGPKGPPARASDERVAVIVTHHERPALVLQTLDSLAGQTLVNFDLVLVDDGSRSPEALAMLAAVERRPWPFRLTVLRQANGYLGAARNAGIRATRAERILFMDDDNLAFPTLLEDLDRAMSGTGADIVTCQMAVFRTPVEEPDLDLLDLGERWAFSGGPVELGLSINCFGDATGLYRRALFEAIGFFHEWRGIGHEDWHFYARAALAGRRIVSLPVPLFWYRRVSTGMLGTTDMYLNNKIIWDLYAAALPPRLRRLMDLAVRSPLVDARS